MKKRLIGTMILLIVTVPLLIIGGIPYIIGIGILSIAAYKEIVYLKLPNEKVLPNTIIFLGFAAYIFIVYSNFDGANLIFGLDYNIIAAASLATLLPVVFINNKEKYNVNRAFKLLGMIVMLGLAFNLFITVFNYDKKIFFYLIAISVLTDTFAYLSGSLIGKHKCAPKISPKKSWEGSIAGSLTGTLVSVFFYINLINRNVDILNIISITLILSIIGQLGDLFFSAIKREYNIKDYSNLIPGHGGILDRFDSIIFILLGYLLFYTYL